MKYLGLILVVVAFVAGQVLAKSINEKDIQLKSFGVKLSYNEKLRRFLENARIIIREGNSTLGIPVLDPFVSEKIEVELNEKHAKGTFEASNFNVTGLSDYIVDKAEISMLSQKLTIGLTFPHIHSVGSYNLDVVTVDDFRAFGKGDYTATVTDLSFTSNVWINVFGGLSIKKMETTISLGALALSATGIFNDDDSSKLTSEVISDMAPQLIQDYQKELTSTVNDIATRIINQFLKGKSLADIIAMLD